MGTGASAATPRCTAAPSTRSTSSPRPVSRSSSTTRTPTRRSTPSSGPRRRGRSATGRCGRCRWRRWCGYGPEAKRGPDAPLSVHRLVRSRSPLSVHRLVRSRRPLITSTATAIPSTTATATSHGSAKNDALADSRVPRALAVSVTSPQSSWGAPRHGSLSRTRCPGSSSEGIFVSPRDSNVRPNRPWAFSRHLRGEGDVARVVQGVRDRRRAVPEAGDEGLVVGDADVLDGDRGDRGPAHPEVDAGAHRPLHPDRERSVARSTRSSSATNAPGWSPGSAFSGTRRVNGTVTEPCAGTVTRERAGRAHAPTPRCFSFTVRTANPPSRAVLYASAAYSRKVSGFAGLVGDGDLVLDGLPGVDGEGEVRAGGDGRGDGVDGPAAVVGGVGGGALRPGTGTGGGRTACAWVRTPTDEVDGGCAPATRCERTDQLSVSVSTPEYEPGGVNAGTFRDSPGVSGELATGDRAVGGGRQCRSRTADRAGRTGLAGARAPGLGGAGRGPTQLPGVDLGAGTGEVGDLAGQGPARGSAAEVLDGHRVQGARRRHRPRRTRRPRGRRRPRPGTSTTTRRSPWW